MNRIGMALLTTVLLAGPELAVAQPSPAASDPIVVDKRVVASQRSSATGALAQKVAQRGRVRVIVELATPMRAPHDLSSVDAARQSRNLRDTQASVSRRVSGSAAATGVVNFEHIPFMSMFVDASQLDRLMADPAVTTITEDVPVPPVLNQSVPFINPTGQGLSFLARGTYAVAILDTGVDGTHKMFPGRKIMREACFSTTDPGISASVCPGGARSAVGPGAGVNCPLFVDGCLHGTHVAGIAAGNMIDPQLRGVAHNSPIIAVQVFSRFREPYCFGWCALSYTTDQVRALEWLYRQRTSMPIGAVNLSLGGGLFFSPCDSSNSAFAATVDLLRRARIATVIAAGNSYANGALTRPGCVSTAIAVGATLHAEDTLADYSNHSPQVRMLAPGSDILSSVPPGPATTDVLSGTSMATPHVAGAFALLREASPRATVDDISAALECTGVSVSRGDITERRINIVAARKYLLNPPNARMNFDFSTGAQKKEWTATLGTWAIEQGRYRVIDERPGWHMTSMPNCDETLTITSRMRRVWPGGQTNNAGILFKAQLSGANGERMSGYMAAFSRDTASNDRQNVVLWRFDAYDLATGSFGLATQLCGAELPTIKGGTYYDLKVVSAGGAHRVLVNGTERCSAADRTYGTGRAGLITFFATPATGNRFEVDSFEINPSEDVPPDTPPPGVLVVQPGGARDLTMSGAAGN